MRALYPGCALRRTGAPGEARRLAAQAVREGFATIIAAGGDGTANEVVNGMADVPQGLALVRLGLLPLGTVNVFARELRLPRQLPAIVRILAAGREMTMDLGCVEFGAGGDSQRRYFLQLAGAGIDARAVELVSWALKKKAGPLAYVAAGLRAMREAQPLIAVEGPDPMSGELVLVGNGRLLRRQLRVFSRRQPAGRAAGCARALQSLGRARPPSGLGTGDRPASPVFCRCGTSARPR